MSSTEATVEVLTAEVRTLMVGKRQVTLSVYRQLDRVLPSQIEPFGRVRDGAEGTGRRVDVVGCHTSTGALVRSGLSEWAAGRAEICSEETGSDEPLSWPAIYETWSALPLIVLAGLR